MSIMGDKKGKIPFKEKFISIYESFFKVKKFLNILNKKKQKNP